jgi:hypothetical protein
MDGICISPKLRAFMTYRMCHAVSSGQELTTGLSKATEEDYLREMTE